MRRWISRIASTIFLLGLIAACLAFWAYRQTRSVPEFYERARAAAPDNAGMVSRELQRQVEQLQEDVQHKGGWRAEFTDDQINAWLISVLPTEFPKLLPPGVDEPRVAIEDGKILAAARYKKNHIDTIVSFEIKVELTEQPNVLAVRLENLRAGRLPLPISRFAKGISREAAKSDFEVLWDKDSLDDAPVAFITIPREHEKYVNAPVIIESVDLESGILSMSGHTGPDAVHAFQPQGPVYYLASLELVGYMGVHAKDRSSQPPGSSRSKTTN
ncbi:hypothetical protein [Roseimaritima sediminicola]|uniref:hypothetical protein n=1 Tax=Roseimaritima sediminicola TaxID=2662066 RepID=UPI0012984E68|nr:hypothetical protein [Roseimaritima sediminicola]